MANTTWSGTDKTAGITLSGGNLIATASSGNNGIRAVDRQITGKFYWEVTFNTANSVSDGIGVAAFAWVLSSAQSNPGLSASSSGINRNGTIFVDGNSSGSTLGVWSSGQLFCIAVDCAARLIWYRLGAAGNWNASASANPATGTGGIAIPSLGIGIPLYPNAVLFGSSSQLTANFGDSAFTGSVPAGFTSGFPTGTPPLNAIDTQHVLEQWASMDTTAPLQAQATQVLVEHWASVQTGPTTATATIVLIEQWASVVLPITTPPPRTVCVIT